MSTHLLEAVSIGSAYLNEHEKQGDLIAASTNELASLRFAIILTARWEASANEELERRDELRAELKDLRLQYFQKIDDIAMTYGVRSAMNAKEEVERTVAVPLGMDLDLSITPSKGDNRYC
jgi:hypothetical protein